MNRQQFVRFFQGNREFAEISLVENLMNLMIDLRTGARAKKDFETADQIRDRLSEIGLVLEDRKDGTGWKRQDMTN